MKFDAREKVNKEAGTKRMFFHAIMTPGRPGWLDKVGEEMEKLRPDSWKGYTIGDNTNKHLSKHPYRLDNEKIMYPFYERLVKWSKDHPSIVNVCIHKGLFPPSVEQQFPHLVGYCHVGDVGKAAKDWPQLNFIIYHSGYRWAGGGSAEQAWAQLERTGRIEWVNDLAEIPAQYGVKNVYGDLGQIFAQSTMADPRVCAFMMGTLIKGLGADHVVWGSTRSGPARRNGRSKRSGGWRFPRRCKKSVTSNRSVRRRTDQARHSRREQCAALPLQSAAALGIGNRSLRGVEAGV